MGQIRNSILELWDSSYLVLVELAAKKLSRAFITKSGCSSGI